jgi:hypothetical protein
MTLNSTLLFEMILGPLCAISLGETTCAERRLATIGGGRFEGPELKGAVEPGGTDWINVRSDGVRELDVRLVLRTDEGEAFAMAYRGYRVDAPDPAGPKGAHLYRTLHWFEAGGRLAWLNQVVAAGVGARDERGLVYNVYRIG